MQPSAHPYHDWNERVTAECYAANASSRILNDKGLIEEMVNNYAMMSFNFGPTLLSWLEQKAPEVYGAVLEADKKSREKFSGHGSAIAQAYNHMIMPLASSRDKKTQIIWGMEDFKYRFRRMPEGMWLPETAVDLESLDIMAGQGIKFTILAPHQAKRVRPLGKEGWREVPDGSIDTTQPYRVILPSGRNMAVFFYNGPLSRSVAFERLLSNGEIFAQRLAGAFSDDGSRPQLSHIATDGETYGHHHRFGEMALAYALGYIPSRNLANLTDYGEYLEKNPPTLEAGILENTSWSCAHGVERWRSDCGCRLGGQQGWSQIWRGPLREGFDWLRDTVTGIFEKEGRALFQDPWKARDEYIRVMLDRSERGVRAFLSGHLPGEADPERIVTALRLLEMQRQAMLMYTSCGWFFDDLAGIETIQVMQYAARTLELAEILSGTALEEGLLSRLEKARSNMPGRPDGRSLYEENVKSAMVDMERVGAHYAMSGLFKVVGGSSDIYCYNAILHDHKVERAGKSVFMTGKMTVTSRITWESRPLVFAALHMGDHNLACGIKKDEDQETAGSYLDDMEKTFSRGNLPGTLRLMDRNFDKGLHSLESLLKNGQNEVLDLILEPSLREAEAAYQRLYVENAPLLRYLKEAGITPPGMLHLAAEAVLNGSLSHAFEEGDFSEERIKTLLKEAANQGITLDGEFLDYALRRSMVRLGNNLLKNPSDWEALRRLVAAVKIIALLPFRANLWEMQNVVYRIIREHFANIRDMAGKGDARIIQWIGDIRLLAEKLFIALE